MWGRTRSKPSPRPSLRSTAPVQATSPSRGAINPKDQESLLALADILRGAGTHHPAQFYLTPDCNGDARRVCDLQVGQRFYTESTGILLRVVRTEDTKVILSGPQGTEPVVVDITEAHMTSLKYGGKQVVSDFDQSENLK